MPNERHQRTNKHYDTHEIPNTEGHSRSSSQAERERIFHRTVTEAVLARVPEGIDADARRWKDLQSSDYKNYSKPDDLKYEFPRLDGSIDRELLGLEKELRKIVRYGQYPVYRITFEDAQAIGARNARWAHADKDIVNTASSSDHERELKTAREDIQFLRHQLQSLECLVYGRHNMVINNMSFNEHRYETKRRPADADKPKPKAS
jgi:hypothetical protein